MRLMAHARFWSRVAGVTPALRLTIFGPFRINSVNLAYPVALITEERLLKAERSSQNVPFVTSQQPSAALSTRAGQPLSSVTA